MTDSNGIREYRVGHVPFVINQLRDIVEQSESDEDRELVANLMANCWDKLKHNPQNWGDPIRKTVAAGGEVFRRYSPPLVIEYVVFPAQHVVFLLRVRKISSD